MGTPRNRCRVVAIAAGVMLVLAGCSLQNLREEASSSLTVDCGVQHQTIEGFGAACAFWDASSAAVYADSAFQDRIANDLGLSILRFEVNPRLQLREDLNAGVLDLATFDFEALRVAGDLAGALRSRVGEDFKLICSVWSPPAWMKTNGSTRNGGALRADRVPHFAKYCAGLCQGFEKTYRVPIHAMSLQNEPLFAEPYDSCVYTAAQLRDVTQAVRAAFSKEGVTTRLMGHEDVGCGFARRYAALLAPTMRDAPKALDFCCIHGYAGDGRTAETSRRNWMSLRDALAPYKRALWMTETSGHAHDTWNGGMTAARHIHESLTYGNCAAWLYWQLTMPHGKVGYALCLDGQPTLKYHAVKHFFRYVRPGSVRVDAGPDTSGLNISAFTRHADRSLTIVLINNESAPRRAVIRLDRLLWPIASFAQFRSTRHEPCVEAEEISVASDGSVTLEIPGSAIVTLRAQASL